MAGVRVLYVGVSKELQSHINGLLNAPVISAIDNSEIFFENLEKITDETADFVCISAEMSDITALELAQSLRMQAPNSQIYFIAYQGKFQDVHDLAKNGCNEVYFLPVDETLIRKTLRGIETALAGEPVERMEAVPLVDLEPNTALDFESSIYLPMNNKYVKVNRKGQAIKESHFNRMKEQAISQIYINEQDLSKFLSYTTQRLKNCLRAPNRRLKKNKNCSRPFEICFKI